MKILIILLTIICVEACYSSNDSIAVSDTQQRPDSICLYYSLFDAHSIVFKENTDVWSFLEGLDTKKLCLNNQDIVREVFKAYKQVLSNGHHCAINEEAKELYPDVSYALVLFSGNQVDTLGVDFKKNTAIHCVGDKDASLIMGEEEIYSLQCIMANILKIKDSCWLLNNKGNFEGANSESLYRHNGIKKWISWENIICDKYK